MKNLIVALVILLAFSCDTKEKWMSEGTITGDDLRMCVCHCGGTFIEINGTTYRFNREELPPNSNLSLDKLPLKVMLNWELYPTGSGCDAGDRILIAKIEKKKWSK